MAWLGIGFFCVDTLDHKICCVWIHITPTSLYLRREEKIWPELELYPDPLASQATALTTRPWLHRLFINSVYSTQALAVPQH